MPKRVIHYHCKFCSRDHKDKQDFAAFHEKYCLSNPKAEKCGNCSHGEKKKGGYFPYWCDVVKEYMHGDRSCDVDKFKFQTKKMEGEEDE